MSERDSARRERGAATLVRPDERSADPPEEWAASERENTERRPASTEAAAQDGGEVLQGLFGLTEEATWQERALCAQTDPEAFFPEKGGSTREAKRICTTCEVRAECLEYALEHDERFGIWGGLSERERRRIKRRAV